MFLLFTPVLVATPFLSDDVRCGYQQISNNNLRIRYVYYFSTEDVFCYVRLTRIVVYVWCNPAGLSVLGRHRIHNMNNRFLEHLLCTLGMQSITCAKKTHAKTSCQGTLPQYVHLSSKCIPHSITATTKTYMN